MSVLQAFALTAVAMLGLAVVLAREPLHQAFVVGVYGFALAALFFAFQAPDVAMSEIVVATVALPIMIVLALVKIREHEQEDE